MTELALAARAFGHEPGELVALASPHATNALFVVGGERPASVIKVFASKRAGEIERAALAALAERARGQLPRVLAETVIDGSLALKLEWLPARLWTVRHDAAGHRFVRDLAELVEHVHDSPLPVTGWGSLIGGDDATSWAQWLWRRLRERGTRLHALGLVAEPALDAVARRLDAAAPRLLRAAGRPALVHNDLNRSNVLQLDDGRPAVIDFERSFAGHGRYELVKLDWLVQECETCAGLFCAANDQTDVILPLYRLVYAVDMAVYLAQTGNPEDRPLLASLLSLIESA
jgi:Ser/Thr protein kinase RdoA (MazF antagonist)